MSGRFCGRRSAALIATLLASTSAWSQVGTPFEVAYHVGEKLRITERSNLRRYQDGRFIGLASREVRGLVEVVDASATTASLEGSFYVFEETRHNATLVAHRIDEVVPVAYRVATDGSYLVASDQRFPSLRSFPVFPSFPLRQGQQWEEFGVLAVEPFRDGVTTRVRFISQFTYQGRQILDGVEYEVIAAQFAPRYRSGQDPDGDPRIARISGRHLVQIYYDAARRKPAFIRDNVEETYELRDGGSVGYRGFNLVWYDPVVSLNRARVVTDLQRALEEGQVAVAAADEDTARLGSQTGAGSPSAGPRDDGASGSGVGAGGGTADGGSATGGGPPIPGGDSGTGSGDAGTGDGGASGGDPAIAGASAAGAASDQLPALARLPLAGPAAQQRIVIEDRPEGVALTIDRIGFVANSAEVLPGERPLLSALADALGTIDGRTFQVIGHTADIGQPQGQMELSVRRARAIVDAMVAAGIPENRFVYQGRGATEPVAPNDSQEGRARNRRVEIILLED